MTSTSATTSRPPSLRGSLASPAIVVVVLCVAVAVALVLMLGGDDLSVPVVPEDEGDEPTEPSTSWDLDSDGDGMPDAWELLWSDQSPSGPSLDPEDPRDMFEDPDEDGYDIDQSGVIERYPDMIVPSRFDLPTSTEHVEVSTDDLSRDPKGFDGMRVLLRDVFVMELVGGSSGDVLWFGDEAEVRVADDPGSPEALWLTVRLEGWSNHPTTIHVYDRSADAGAGSSWVVDVQGVAASSPDGPVVTVRGGEAFTNLMEYQSAYYTGDRSVPSGERDLYSYNRTSPFVKDSDRDGMCDGWEAWYGDRVTDPLTGEARWSVLDPTNPLDAGEDPDGDAVETRWALVQWLWVDSDGDGRTEPPDGQTPVDYVIVGENLHEYIAGTNPRVADTDKDSFPPDSGSMNDFDELLFHGTDPLLADTDGDDVPDGYEVYYNLLPLDPQDGDDDPDGDGLTNEEEYRWNLNPNRRDSDGDGMPDGWEVWNALDPRDPADGPGDSDGDGLLNVFEYLNGTDPWSEDTDGDHLNDYAEVVFGWYIVVDGVQRHVYSDPNWADTDGDDREDDEDGDGNSDANEEILDGVDNDGDADVLQANGIDDDGDGVVDDGRAGIPAVGLPEGVDEERDLNDWNEVNAFKTDPSRPDTDGDRLDDWREWFTDLDEEANGVQRTQPTISDTDGDGLTDGQEIMGMSLWLPGYTDAVQRRTDPLEPDSDGDGVPDGYEVLVDLLPETPGVVNSTDPMNPDTDSDGMPDGYELEFSDIDGDGLPTGWEMEFCHIHPGAELERDSDGDGQWDPFEDWDIDGLTNLGEYMWRCDPLEMDTDGDGFLDPVDLDMTPRHLRPIPRQPVFSDSDGDLMPDWWEVLHGLNPDSSLDAFSDEDDDHLVNIDEYIYDLDPTSPDTDGDGESDLFDHEIMSSPDAYDSDGDGIADWWERLYAEILDPRDPGDARKDPDGDGWTNLEEWIFAADPYTHVPTDPTSASTDGDGLLDPNDPYPVRIIATVRPLNPDRDCTPLHPLAALIKDGRPQAEMDMDRDGLNNSRERTLTPDPTDPMDPDTDADGMPDGWEAVNAYWDPFTGKPNLSPVNGSDAYDDPDWDGINYSLKRDPLGNWIICQRDTNGDGFPDPTFENETFCNLEEYLFGEDLDRDGINDRTSHPNKWDTDGDGISDGWEVLLNDCDGDGMSTWFELIYGLDPLWPEGDDGANGDPDGDGWSNLEESQNNTDPTDPTDPGGLP